VVTVFHAVAGVHAVASILAVASIPDVASVPAVSGILDVDVVSAVACCIVFFYQILDVDEGITAKYLVHRRHSAPLVQ